jgi:hypothetical protein
VLKPCNVLSITCLLPVKQVQLIDGTLVVPDCLVPVLYSCHRLSMVGYNDVY